jgi:hypothetical protein
MSGPETRSQTGAYRPLYSHGTSSHLHTAQHRLVSQNFHYKLTVVSMMALKIRVGGSRISPAGNVCKRLSRYASVGLDRLRPTERSGATSRAGLGLSRHSGSRCVVSGNLEQLVEGWSVSMDVDVVMRHKWLIRVLALHRLMVRRCFRRVRTDLRSHVSP